MGDEDQLSDEKDSPGHDKVEKDNDNEKDNDDDKDEDILDDLLASKGDEKFDDGDHDMGEDSDHEDISDDENIETAASDQLDETGGGSVNSDHGEDQQDGALNHQAVSDISDTED